jgi:hypothetical protein
MKDVVPSRALQEPETSDLGSPSSEGDWPDAAAATMPEQAHSIPSSVSPDRGAVFFVWSIWLLALLSALVFVAQYGFNIPKGDDFEMIAPLTGDRPITGAWLWSQHNEHRIPLPRLILLALGKVSGCDFRAGMYFNVLGLGALAFGLIWAAKGLRGWISYSDAIFPLGLLHWGHWETILWSFQVALLLPMILAGTLLVIMLRSAPPFKLGTGILAGSCLLLLPLCGVAGLGFVPPLACWLAYCGVLTWADGGTHSKRTGIVMLFLTVAAVLLVGLYFVGYQRPAKHPASPGAWATLQAGAGFLSMSCGPVALDLWPYLPAGIVGMLIVSQGLLIRAWFKLPQKRAQALGLFVFIASIGALALGVGLGRASLDPRSGLAPRYVSIAVPLLFCVYYTAQLVLASGSRFVQMVLFTVTCAVFSLNMQKGYASAAGRGHVLSAFERELVGGTPNSVLAKRYSQILNPNRSAEYVELCLYKLHKAGIKPFDGMQVTQVPHDYAGHHDVADCERIIGWAWDADRPNTPVDVDIFDGDRLLARVSADIFRRDLLQAGYGDGRHGFEYRVPRELKDGRRHLIVVRIANTTKELLTTRRLMTCEDARSKKKAEGK